jgi:hypothetical protein
MGAKELGTVAWKKETEASGRQHPALKYVAVRIVSRPGVLELVRVMTRPPFLRAASFFLTLFSLRSKTTARALMDHARN